MVHATPGHVCHERTTGQADGAGDRRCEYGRDGHGSYLYCTAGHTRVVNTTEGKLQQRQVAFDCANQYVHVIVYWVTDKAAGVLMASYA